MDQIEVIYERELRESSEALDYLTNHRGLSPEIVQDASLGYVAEPGIKEHEQFRGWISIPYFTPLGGLRYIRFRRLDAGKPKYKQPYGVKLVPYSLELLPAAQVFITEGEIDALTLQDMGHAAVALPGAKAWKKPWRWMFRECDLVSVIMDSDNDGQLAQEKILIQLEQAGIEARGIELPVGKDVNDLYVERREELEELIRL
jgi:DNA primase